MNLSCQKSLFSLDEGVHYINCATMSPNLISVEEAGIQGILRKSQPQKITSQDFFEVTIPVKKAYAQLINCEPERLAIIPSTSYGMAIVAKNLARKATLQHGQTIVMVGEEFPSDVYAWEEICAEKHLKIHVVEAPHSLQDRGKLWNQRLLEAITSHTCMVVISPVHWADGTQFDLVAIGKQCRAVGAWLVLDGTQAIGAMPFDCALVQPDAIVNVGYKWLLGPYASGIMYLGPCFDEGLPLERNWINRVGSDDFKNLVQYQTTYRPQAERYNMGERSNFILNPMLAAAIEQINAWGVGTIQAYCQQLLEEPLALLQEKGCWVEEQAYRSKHLVGVRLPSRASTERIQQQLHERNIFVSFRGEAIRIAPHVYNDANDIDALVDALLEGL